jgi:hypothetical protein
MKSIVAYGVLALLLAFTSCFATPELLNARSNILNVAGLLLALAAIAVHAMLVYLITRTVYGNVHRRNLLKSYEQERDHRCSTKRER